MAAELSLLLTLAAPWERAEKLRLRAVGWEVRGEARPALEVRAVGCRGDPAPMLGLLSRALGAATEVLPLAHVSPILYELERCGRSFWAVRAPLECFASTRSAGIGATTPSAGRVLVALSLSRRLREHGAGAWNEIDFTIALGSFAGSEDDCSRKLWYRCSGDW